MKAPIDSAFPREKDDCALTQQFDHQRLPYVIKREGVDAGSKASGPVMSHWRLASTAFDTRASINWVRVRGLDSAGPYCQADSGLLIVLRGRGEFRSITSAYLEPGDVVTLPANGEYSLQALADDLEVLQLVFRGAPGRGEEREKSLQDVLVRNQQRLRAWLKSPYIGMLQDGTLVPEAKRFRFKQCIRVFSDVFQTFLFTRQAMCRAPEYHAVFHSHLAEEFGHNKLLAETMDSSIRTDPSLKATLNWFSHQMFKLDDAGKVAINLVLESAGYHFHSLASPKFQGDEAEAYFGTHAEDDEQHQDMGLTLLSAEHPATYRHLVQIVDQGWDMLEATTERIFEIVQAGDEAS